MYAPNPRRLCAKTCYVLTANTEVYENEKVPTKIGKGQPDDVARGPPSDVFGG